MALHFQPSADSSDEGEVDITAWQASEKKSRASAQPPAPVANMFNTADDEGEGEDEIDMTTLQQPTAGSSADAQAGDEDDDEPMGLSIDGDSETPQALSANRSPSQDPATVAPSGFTSINQRADDESDDVELSARRSRSKSKTASKKKEMLVPRVSRTEVDVDEYEDLTKDGEVVLRVKKELPGKRGRVRYIVELGDYTIREVGSGVFVHAASVVLVYVASSRFCLVSAMSVGLDFEVSQRIGFRHCDFAHHAPDEFLILP